MKSTPINLEDFDEFNENRVEKGLAVFMVNRVLEDGRAVESLYPLFLLAAILSKISFFLY